MTMAIRLSRGISEFRRNPSAVLGAVLVAGVLVMGIVGPVLAPYSANESVPGGLSQSFLPPSAEYWFGTDGQGRDEFSRVLHGARLSLLAGVCAVLFGAVVGTVIGAIAGYLGKLTDAITMRSVDILLAFPAMLLAIGIVAAFGQGLPQVIIAVGITTVPIFARLVRGEVLRQRHLDYVAAAITYGAGMGRIIGRHLVPNAMRVVIAQATLMMSTAVMEVAALGYLGLGPADPGVPEWGSMLTDATQTLRTAPYLVLWPSLALVATAVGFNLLGDGLRNAVEES